ncbi:SusD/RagB family nutrient-binding outer membrane lipoprotein [Gabonibacter massiliensis]|uniref:SusD/RagB family nutrient-binding outer membrane lipoprotein n=1 Tax=Gabonibacter massiliensis TaxID=1720195 RepID=UPI00073E27CE|nr:SusD/RagB family nutrient-binding outer membrane lipoprotein [Gabonibacter massiliensis]
MKKIHILTVISLAILLFAGCGESYFDINQNPNRAVESNMTPNLILPSALNRVGVLTAATQPSTDFTNLNGACGDYQQWMGYYARCAGTYGPNTDVEAFQLSASFHQGVWHDWMDVLKDLDVMEKSAVAREETAYEAIAKIVKAIGFMTLVDQYNNIPYSKCFDIVNYMLTPYDKGEDVYKDLLEQLAKADELLKEADLEKNYDIKRADVVFSGDLGMWRKLGNTQRLRMLMHEADFLGAAALKTEVDKIVANGAGFLGEGETAAVHLTYSADKGKQNPFWNTYKVNDQGVSDAYFRANNFFLSLLRNNGDIRYTYFYSRAKTPTGGEYYIGFDFGAVDNSLPDGAHSSMVSGPGIAKSVDMPQWFLPSFESLFLQAEAIQRGALAGDAQTVYERAVTESFVWLEVEDAAEVADNYLHPVEPTDTKFAEWGSHPDKLRLIYLQKYIAMYGINGVESWTDYRRTGVPDIPRSKHPSVGNNRIPYRLIYPTTEYQFNNKNATAQGTINPQANKIFWDKN